MSSLQIPIWRESRWALEHLMLRRDPVLRGEGVPHGNGSPVMLIPGFLASDVSLSLMAAWVKRIGYQPTRAGMRANVDCAERALGRLEELLVAKHERAGGRRVAIVGQSRGGSFARMLAVRRPDLISGIVTLGSPLTDQLAVHPFVRGGVLGVGLLGTLGVPGLFRQQCMTGACCEQARDDAEATFPKGVGFVSVYSKSDGIVDWRASLDSHAEHVEVDASHVGMSVHADTYRAIAGALHAFAASERQRAGERNLRRAA